MHNAFNLFFILFLPLRIGATIILIGGLTLFCENLNAGCLVRTGPSTLCSQGYLIIDRQCNIRCMMLPIGNVFALV